MGRRARMELGTIERPSEVEMALCRHMPFADVPKCKRIKRNGEKCKNICVTGLDVCRMHGGASQKAKAAGLRRRAGGVDPFMPKVGDIPKRDFVDAETAACEVLAQLLRLSDFVGRIVEHYSADDLLIRDSEVGSRVSPMVELLRGLLSDTAKWTNSALKLRIEDRRVRVDEVRSRWIVDVIVRGIDHVNMPTGMRQELVEFVAAELTAGRPASSELVGTGACGTEGGRQKHRERGEALCDACASAYNEAQARRRAGKQAQVHAVMGIEQ